MANTPLAATVSALSNGGSLRSLRSAKVSVASDDCGSAVDYSVQSGPAADSSSSASTSSAAAAAMCASPKLDFTVTSAVPNTGTYPRRSTVSNTLDSDSDYVTLPPLCPRMQDNNVVMVPNSYVFMEPMQPKNGGQVTVACVNQLSLRHGVNCKMIDDVASTTYSASSCSSSQMMGLTRPMSAAAAAAAAAAASEAAARFITTRPTISILQAHTASTAPATQPSFATPAQHLIPPPPYDIRQHPFHAVYAEDSLNDTKTNGSSSLYGVITTDPEVAASVAAGNSGAQVAPVIGKNNYLDIHATNTLSRRPQHPIPSGAQQQSASAQIVQQVNGTVTGGASVPYEQYHLGIPPPPQYPGNGVNSSSKASFATVYTNQVTQSQIEQFKAQLYSDVDYVIYPHKDPSLSQQEYLDVKEAASFISSAASSTYSDQGQMMLMGDGAYLPPPPPYRAPSTKSGASSVYRSSPMPNVHLPPVSSTGGIVLSGTTPASHPPLQHLGYGYSSHHQGAGARPASVHYASNQSSSSGNYSSSYSTSNYSSNYSAQVPMAYVPYPSKYLSCQSLASSHSSNPSAAYSASGCYSASSSHSMTGSYEPIGAAIQHAGAALRCKPMAPLPDLSRVHSEESILTYDLPQVTTLSSAIARHQEARGLLPPPPPYRKQSLDTPSAPGSTCSSGAPSIATDSTCPSEGAAQGKTTGQPPPKPGGQVNGQSHAYVMPRHPASVSMSQAESSPCRRPALTTPRRNPVAAVQQASQSRPTSWHVDGNNWNVGQGDPAVNGEKSNAPPPPLPPPNSNSAIEAKLQQLQKAAVAIATGPGSIIAEDGKIAKALNLPAFKSVKNSYVVSPSRKHPVSGLYAVTELGKPPSGSRKITPTAFSHPHNNAGSKVSQHTVPNSSSLSNGKTSFGVVP
ncbi:hypothetical protein DAPPUDRAFT_318158 [Daphnia pulex]|uniref:Uncharacterized protein n=1 Tax=Daphnia pulex TaxID=6669 RepID=E9GI18_DAPPU|nr:hypothetical protein DAPPUDRAFT_318158 [Daphnia pulex]|eukprot:EFX80953.1 hypothetical protein DAPPUDRAFT_318158 [Daphnia pulex]